MLEDRYLSSFQKALPWKESWPCLYYVSDPRQTNLQKLYSNQLGQTTIAEKPDPLCSFRCTSCIEDMGNFKDRSWKAPAGRGGKERSGEEAQAAEIGQTMIE